MKPAVDVTSNESIREFAFNIAFAIAPATFEHPLPFPVSSERGSFTTLTSLWMAEEKETETIKARKRLRRFYC